MDMLHWSILALLASFFWGCVNLADKTILSHYKLTPWDYLALDGLVGLLPLAAILVWASDILLVPLEVIAFATLSGMALAAFSIIYFYALRMSDVAVVAILIQTTPVFSLIWGVWLLQEHYGNLTYVGMVLVFLGAVVASVSERHKGKENVTTRIWAAKTSLAPLLMLAATFIVSISFLFQKFALRDASVLTVFFWQRSCLVLVSFSIIGMRRIRVWRLTFAPVILTSAVEVVNLLGVLSVIAAYSIGPLALVSFLTSLQPLWVLVLVSVLGTVKPETFPVNKNVSRLQLLVACGLVILGLYFMREAL